MEDESGTVIDDPSGDGGQRDRACEGECIGDISLRTVNLLVSKVRGRVGLGQPC